VSSTTPLHLDVCTRMAGRLHEYSGRSVTRNARTCRVECVLCSLWSCGQLPIGARRVRPQSPAACLARNRVPDGASQLKLHDLNSRPLCIEAARRLDPHAAVLAERPAGIVRDLPHIAVRIGEGPRRTAPLRAGGRAHDGATCPFGVGQYAADLLGQADVVGELDPGRTVTAERCPQAEDHPPGLKEADLIIGLLCVLPAKRLIERTRSGKIGDAKRYKADALVHPEIIADAARCTLMPLRGIAFRPHLAHEHGSR
jgi:hypothetical protein